jgi:hypothetical protein
MYVFMHMCVYVCMCVCVYIYIKHTGISGLLLDDPVLAADGFSYERKLAEFHFGMSNLSPVTKQPLGFRDLFTNNQLRCILLVRECVHVWIRVSACVCMCSHI